MIQWMTTFSLSVLYSSLFYLSCSLCYPIYKYEEFYLEPDPHEYYCLNARGELYIARGTNQIEWDSAQELSLKPTLSQFDPPFYARGVALFDEE